MAITDVIKRLIYRYSVEGADKVVAANRDVAASGEQVAKTSEKQTQASLSLEKSFNNLERRFNAQVRAQQDYAKVQKTVQDAVGQNAALHARGQAVLALAAKHYENASVSGRAYAATQGQIMASATALNSRLGGIGAVLGAIGPAGIAAGAGIAGVALAFSQLTAGVNALADRSGKMVDFAQTVELTTGQVRALNIAGAQVGIDADKIATNFEKFANEVEQAKDGQGKLFAELVKIDPALARQLTQARDLAEAWDILGKAQQRLGGASAAIGLNRAAFGRGGAGMGRLQDESSRAGGIAGLERGAAGGVGDFADDALKRWDAAGDEINEKSKQVRDGFVAIFADDVQRAQKDFWGILERGVQNLQKADSVLRNAGYLKQRPGAGDAQRGASGGDGSTISTAELQALQQQSALQSEVNAKVELAIRLKAESKAAEERSAQVVLEIADAYRGLTVEQAKQVHTLKQQEVTASAITGLARMQAQEEATINNLLMQGVTLQQAQAVAAQQRAVAVAAANANAERTLKSLEEEYELLKAGSEEEERRIKARQTYERLVRDGVDESRAASVASQQLANEEERAAQAAEDNVHHVQRLSPAIQAANQAVQDFNARWERNLAIVQQVNEELKYTGVESAVFNPRTGDIIQMPDTSNLFRSNQGGYSQFNPGGYTSELVDQAFAAPKTGDQQIAELFAEGRSLQEIFLQALKLDPSGSTTDQIAGLLGDDQEAWAINQQIAALRQQPRSLETEQAMASLIDRLQALTSATGDNTAATHSNTGALGGLSPYFSQDPRTTRLGFRAGVMANQDWFAGGTNENPLTAITGAGSVAASTYADYVNPDGTLRMNIPGVTGFAEGGSFVVPGALSPTDNRMVAFPAASGETVSVSRKGAAGNVISIDNSVTIMGNVDREVMQRVGRTQYQQAQTMSRMLQ
jgi:hypothetical protein